MYLILTKDYLGAFFNIFGIITEALLSVNQSLITAMMTYKAAMITHTAALTNYRAAMMTHRVMMITIAAGFLLAVNIGLPQA